MRLEDLRVATPFGATRPDGVTANRVPFDLSPASVADLVAALIAEGGEIEERTIGFSDVEGRTSWLVEVPEPGRYLVYPIPTEES